MATISGQTTDGTSTTVLVDKEGRLDIAQSDLYSVFSDMLKEMKKMNLQLALITDEFVTNEEVE